MRRPTADELVDRLDRMAHYDLLCNPPDRDAADPFYVSPSGEYAIVKGLQHACTAREARIIAARCWRAAEALEAPRWSP